MTSTITASNPSVQWMLNVGVDEADVLWLERMSGSVELHMPGNRERVESIYTSAIKGMLASGRPAQHLMHALN